jgi:hypothetical protein
MNKLFALIYFLTHTCVPICKAVLLKFSNVENVEIVYFFIVGEFCVRLRSNFED